jgi:hypothetical protein
MLRLPEEFLKSKFPLSTSSCMVNRPLFEAGLLFSTSFQKIIHDKLNGDEE